jgi:hypothetical protein
MTDMQTRDQAVSTDGQSQSEVTSTTQTAADPVTGASVRRSTTRAWSGTSPAVGIVWLLAGIVLAFIALDFIFHASGANNVGFASFVFSVGTFLAAPFAGIFRTTYAAHGNLIIWADVLAMVIYALLAVVIVKVVAMAAARSATCWPSTSGTVISRLAHPTGMVVSRACWLLSGMPESRSVGSSRGAMIGGCIA